MSNALRMFHRLLIVPGAHVRVGDFRFQAELYDVFHLRWGSRVAHALATPVVLTGAMLALNAIPIRLEGLGALDGIPVGGLVLAVGLMAYLFGLDALVGLVAVLPLFGLFALSVAASAVLGPDALVTGIAMMLVAATAQALSHLVEHVPPPWTGQRGWRPPAEVLGGARGRLLVGLAVLFFVAIALEWWAAFRVFGLQVNFALMQLGLRPELRREVEARRAQILADHTIYWPADRAP